jgi:phospholipase C
MSERRPASAARTSFTALTMGVLLSGGGYTSLFAATPVASTTTPIKHVVVIFQENISFDHYFGTYPNAKNLPGETPFTARAGTPSVNGLTGAYAAPNNTSLAATRSTTVQPMRIGPNDPVVNGSTIPDALKTTTCSVNHSYRPEQLAYHGGQNDLFVLNTGSSSAGCAPDKSTVMSYFDGNTVTAMWNYAQHFAMSDNSYGSTYGPSTVGALNLVAGNTQRVIASPGVTQTVTTVTEAGVIAPPAIARTELVLSDAPGVAIHANDQTTSEHRRSAQYRRSVLGLVPGRLRGDLERSAERRGLPVEQLAAGGLQRAPPGCGRQS